MIWLGYVRVFCIAAISAWLLSAVFILITRGRLDSGNVGLRIARWIFHEVKPFYQAMAVTRFGVGCLIQNEWLWANAVVLGFDLWIYHIYKDVDDDDDRWDRRKREVLEKITVTDGRLSVIPA